MARDGEGLGTPLRNTGGCLKITLYGGVYFWNKRPLEQVPGQKQCSRKEGALFHPPGPTTWRQKRGTGW